MNLMAKIRTAFRKAPIPCWFAAGLLVLAGLLLLAGGLKSGPSVRGKVLLDGEPLPRGSIRFVPVKGTTGSDAGSAIHQGEYRIEKDLAGGKYRVEIQSTRT